MWGLKIKELKNHSLPIKLNYDSDLKTVKNTDSILSLRRVFLINSQLNNLIVKDENNNPLGVIQKKVLADNLNKGMITDLSGSIDKYRANFNIVEKGGKIHLFKLNWSSTLNDVLEKFKDSHTINVDGFNKTVFYESVIITDESDKLYTIISFKDILRLVASDDKLKASFNLKTSNYTDKNGMKQPIVLKSTSQNFKVLDWNNTYSDAEDLFEIGLRTIPLIHDDEFIGFVVNYNLSKLADMNNTIDINSVYYADSFKSIWLSSSQSETLDEVVTKFSIRPFFSSLPIIKNEKTLEGVLSYTNVLRWAFDLINQQIVPTK